MIQDLCIGMVEIAIVAAVIVGLIFWRAEKGDFMSSPDGSATHNEES